MGNFIQSTIYPDYDGVVYKFEDDTWANVRSSSSGTLNVNSSYYIQNSHTSGRGGDTHQIGRYFMAFNTSRMNKTIDSASLNIYGASGVDTLDVILLKSSHTGSVSSGDFDEIDGAGFALSQSNGSGGGTLAALGSYSSEITTWSTSGYNEITLNSSAIADIIANDTFNCVLMGQDYDYRDIVPSEAYYRIPFYQDSYSGTSRDPKLVINEQRNSVFFGINI